MKIRILPTARLSFALASALAALLTAPYAHAVSNSWAADAAGAWATAGSWTGGVNIPGTTTTDNADVATFNNLLTVARAVTVDTTRYIGGITFGATNTSAFGYTLQTGTLQLNSGSIIQTTGAIGANTNTISSPIKISGTTTAAATFTSSPTTAANGRISVTGSVTGSDTLATTTTLTLNGTGTGANAVSGIIQNGAGGALALAKSGAGAWALSGPNTYSGGTTLSAGTVAISNATSFGLSTGNVSVTGISRINATGGIAYANAINVGAALTMQNVTTTATTATFSGVLSGASALTVANNGTNNNNAILAFTNAANTFTGNVILPSSGSGNDFFSFNSIGDAGNFTIQKNGNREGIIYAGSSPITFNTRTITLGTTITGGNFDGNGNPINVFQNNGSGTVTFNSNMGVTTVTGASTLWLDGSNTGNNTFAGTIGNPTSGGNLTIGKWGAGTWLLSGANSYLGNTQILQGTLSVNAIATAATAQPLGKGSQIILGHASGGTLTFTGSSTSTTDKQVQVGFTTAANTGGGSILNNGSGSLTFTNATFNPTIASITATRTLTLGGSSAATNAIQGIIQNNAAAGLVALTVSGSTWKLSGANTYTGATSISAGTLVNGSSTTFTNKSGLAMTTTGVFDLGGFNAAFTTLASAATNSITNSSSSTAASSATTVGTPSGAGVYVDALTFTTAGQTLAAAITDGATRKTQILFNNANSGTDKGGITTTTNGFSGGLVLANNATGTRLRISSLISGTPFGTGPILIGQVNTDKAQIMLDTVIGITLANNIVVNSAVGTDVAGAFRVDTTGHTLSGTLTANANAAFNVTGSVTVSGKITGAGGVVKTGIGTLSLNNTTNDYLGNTVITAGAITIASKDALPGYSTNGRFSVASGAILAVQNTVSEADVGILLGTTNFLSGANLGFDTAAGNRSVAANLADTANGPLAIAKLGANTLTLSGTGAYTGGTNVLAGALNITSTSSLPGWNVNGGFSIANGASLVIPNGVSESEVTTMLGTTNIAAGASLLFDTSAGDRSYTSAVTNSSQGLLNFGKIGANTLTLSGANTYTGTSTVTAGALVLSGSTTTGGNLVIGNTTANALLNIPGGGVMTAGTVSAGTAAASSGALNITGGSLSCATPESTDSISFGAGEGAYGAFTLSSGTFTQQRFMFGGTGTSVTGGTGVGLITGGTVNSTGWLILARAGASAGTLTITGGTLNHAGASNDVAVGLGTATAAANAGRAELNVAGGLIDNTGSRVTFSAGTGGGFHWAGTGIANLNAGTLLTNSFNYDASSPNASSYVNFSGGTLKAATSSTTLLPAFTPSGTGTNRVFVNGAVGAFAGGATIDTNGFNSTISANLLAPSGTGVTSLSIDNAGSGYIGAPAVKILDNGQPSTATAYAVVDTDSTSATFGKLTSVVITNPGVIAGTATVSLVGGGGTGAAVSVASTGANTSGGLTKTGAGILTLSGASTYTGVTSVNAGTLNLTGTLTSNVSVANTASLGGEGSTTGSLTFSGSSDLSFDPSTSGAYLSAASVIATGASVTIAPTVPATGTGIVVLNAPGGITGTAGGVGNNFIYTGRGSLYFNGGNTQLLIDTAPVSLAWRGNDGTNPSYWDLNTTPNWDSGTPQTFFTGDALTFDDTATSYTVNINAANVSPGNITFNNTATYTIQGAFGIIGGATLTKNGTGTTVMNTSNGYTGATSVTAGVLNIRNANALGGTTAGTSVTSGAALEIQGGITTAAEALTLNGSGISNNGALRNISGDNAWGTAVTLASDSSIGSDAGTLTLPSLIGAFGFSKVGAGTVNITGATAVTSTTVEAGTLYMGAQTGASTTTTLGAASAVTLNGSSNLTIRRTNTGAVDLTGAIGGTGSLTLLGDNANTSLSGDFTVNNASTYSGGTTIIGARAAVSAAGGLGTGPITLGTNGQLFVNAASLSFTNNFTLGGGLGWNETSGYLGSLRLNGTMLTGDISLTSNARITSTATTSTLSGIISGGYGLDFFEDTVIGTVSLSGNNTYTGTTVVNSMGSAPATLPNLIVSHNNALGSSAGGTIVYGSGTTGNGSQLTLATGIIVTDETLTLDATAAGYRASLLTAGTATWDGNMVMAGTGGLIGFQTNGTTSVLTVGASSARTITGSNSLMMRGTGTGTINSAINIGSGGLFKTDAGTWTITSNTNDFTGLPTVAAGILSVGSIADSGVNCALGAGTTIALGQNSAAAGTLQFTGTSGGSSNRSLSIANGTTGGAGVIENTVAGQMLALSGTLTVTTPASACSLTLAGAGNGLLSGGIVGTPALALNKTGLGSWTLTGAYTYTGATTIKAGSLVLDTGADRLPSTGSVVVGDTATSGKLILGGTTAADQTLASLTTTGLGGSVVGGNASNSRLTLNVASAVTFSGTLGGAGANENNLALTGGGAGTLTLSGANTYTGGSTIAGGVLSVTNANALGSGAVTFNGGVRLVVASGLEVTNAITIGTNAGGSGRGLVEAGGVSGTATVSGPITIASGALAGGHFYAATGTILHVKGVITASTTGASFAQRAGTVMFSGGGTGYALLINTGTTMVGANDGIATTATVSLGASAAGILDLNGFNQSLVGITKSASAATIGNSSITADSLLTTTGTSSYAGTIVDVIAPGTKKVGLTVASGALTLSGVNTYTGATTVNAGTLLVNSPGSLAGGSAVAVNGTSTLGGNGTIGGNVTVAAAANLAPGASAAGTLTISGALDISALAAGAGTLTYELNTLAGTNDKIVAGTLNIGSGGLGFNDFVFTNLGGLQSGTYKLITSGGLTGTLDAGNLSGMIGAFKATLQLTGNDVELVVSNPYATWAALKGLDDSDAAHSSAKNADPDGDGHNNLYEFAFDGNPLSGVDDGKIVGKVATVSAARVLTLTLPVRNGAIFTESSGDQLSALIDGIYYRIEGDVNLSSFADTITEVPAGADLTAIQLGLPALSSGWTYRTFRAPGTIPTVPNAFLRATISD